MATIGKAAPKSARGMMFLFAVFACSCSPGGRTEGGDAADNTRAPSRGPGSRVFLCAIDGASWDVLDAAMDAGTMPNLRRLVDSGSRGVLRSMEPTASSILWTTIATGRPPEVHGIRGFVTEVDGGRRVPVASTMRRSKALWNIASEAGLEVGFIGWWVTWPAERVRGFMATDYTWPLRKDERGFATGVETDSRRPARTYPPDLARELDRFVKTEARLSAAELSELGVSAIPEIRGYAVRDMLLKDISLGEMTGYLLDRYRPSLFAVYFDGLDAFCHIFWPQFQEVRRARAAGSAVLSPDVAALGRALDLHLARLDGYLGQVVQRAGPADVVMVLSDHGYGDNPGLRPILRGYGEWIRPPHWHTLDGVIAAAGGPVQRGGRIEKATVLDVAPTVLHLLGLPVAGDMEGRVMSGILDQRALVSRPVRYVGSYESEERGGPPVESPYDTEVLERLRSLGYIE